MTPKKGKTQATAPAAAEVPADEEEDVNQLPWEEDLALWEQEEKQEQETSKFILYRRPDGKNFKEKVWEWQDENPGSHFIGMEFGGGRYSMYAILPGKDRHGKTRMRVRHFVLAQSYTEKKRRRDIEEGFSPQFAPTMGRGYQVEQKDGLTQLGDIFDRIVLPMMSMMQKGQPAVQVNPFENMKGMSEMMQGMIQENARSTMRLVNEVQKELSVNRREQAAALGSGAGDPDDGDEAGDFEFKDFLKEAIKEYGPELLKATGLKLKAAASMVKNNEVFQTLSANRSLFDRVFYLLTQDPEVDQDMTMKVLNKLSDLKVGAFVPTRPPGAAPRPQNGQPAAHAAAAAPEPHAS